MAKKELQVTDDLEEFLPATNVEKLPANITRGRTPRADYIDLPIGRLTPYRDKQGSDFSRMKGEKFNQLVKTIQEEGVLDAIAVRPIHDDLFEILAGETRWEGAKAAGLSSVPCRIFRDCDDSRARRIYSITNLNRRDLTIRDKVNGWWHYWEGARKERGRKAASALEEDLDAVPDDCRGLMGDISLRQIQKYHKVHSLHECLLQKLDEEVITLEVAYNLAFLNEEEQVELCRWWRPISLSISESLKKLSQEGKWSKAAVDALYVMPSRAEKGEYARCVDNAMKRLRRQITNKVDPAAVSRLDDILREALELYFKEHPEDQKQN